MNRWLGAIKLASISVSDLVAAMEFFGPVLDFMGFVDREWVQA
jgi:hypothetical protein